MENGACVWDVIDFSREKLNNHDLSPRLYQHEPRGIVERVIPLFSRDTHVINNICHRCDHALRGTGGYGEVHVVKLWRNTVDTSIVATVDQVSTLIREDYSICTAWLYAWNQIRVNMHSRKDIAPYREATIHDQTTQQCPKWMFKKR